MGRNPLGNLFSAFTLAPNPFPEGSAGHACWPFSWQLAAEEYALLDASRPVFPAAPEARVRYVVNFEAQRFWIEAKAHAPSYIVEEMLPEYEQLLAAMSEHFLQSVLKGKLLFDLVSREDLVYELERELRRLRALLYANASRQIRERRAEQEQLKQASNEASASRSLLATSNALDASGSGLPISHGDPEPTFPSVGERKGRGRPAKTQPQENADTIVGGNIDRLRTAKEMTQEDLAGKAGLELSTVQKHTQGRYSPRDSLERYRAALGCEMDDFLMGVDEPLRSTYLKPPPKATSVVSNK